MLFVGINPGVRSAMTGHHFAGYSNRFWKLLWEAQLVPEKITYLDDERLAEWGYGITNLVPRPSPGIDDLRPAEYVDGWTALERKIRRFRPGIVAFVGVTLYRAIRPLLASENGAGRARVPALAVGLRPETIHGSRVFVLPNPSGRNANFSYAEMLSAFKGLASSATKIRSCSVNRQHERAAASEPGEPPSRGALRRPRRRGAWGPRERASRGAPGGEAPRMRAEREGR